MKVRLWQPWWFLTVAIYTAFWMMFGPSDPHSATIITYIIGGLLTGIVFSLLERKRT